MKRYRSYAILLIWFSFLVAVLLQVMPWPTEFLIFRPNLIFLIFLYWLLTVPNRINVGTSFVIGAIIDLINGSRLGIHSLALSIISYFVTLKFQIFRNISLLQQTAIVILLSLTTDLIVFFLEFLIRTISFQPKLFWNSLINGAIWPWLFLLMNKIRQQFFCKDKYLFYTIFCLFP